MMRRQQGFTLIEIMVAVVMITLVLTTVYGVFSSLSGAQQRLEQEEGGYHRARVIFDRLGREIRGAYFSSRNPDTFFTGGENEDGQPYLAFTTTVGTPLGTGAGITRVRYELADDPEQTGPEKVLLRSEAPIFDREAAAETTYRLAPAVDGVTFRFFKNETWSEKWDSRQEGLPQMVEVALTVLVDGRPVPFLSAFEIPSVKVWQ